MSKSTTVSRGCEQPGALADVAIDVAEVPQQDLRKSFDCATGERGDKLSLEPMMHLRQTG